MTYNSHEIKAAPKELPGGDWKVEYQLVVNFGDRSEEWQVFTDTVKRTKQEAIEAAFESGRKKIDGLPSLSSAA